MSPTNTELHASESSPQQTTPSDRRHRRRVAIVTVAAVVLVIGGVGLVRLVRGEDNDAGSDAAAARTVRNLDQTMREALVSADTATIDRILAPDFTFVPPPGDLESRDDLLGSVASGDLDYQDFRAISPVEVTVSGNLAVATYRSHLSVTAGTIHVEHEAWHTHVYELDQGTWREVWAQATAVGGFPPPGS